MNSRSPGLSCSYHQLFSPSVPEAQLRRYSSLAFTDRASLDFWRLAALLWTTPFFLLLSMTEMACGNKASASVLLNAVCTFLTAVRRTVRAALLRIRAILDCLSLLRDDLSLGNALPPR